MSVDPLSNPSPPPARPRRILVLAGLADSLINFRKQLLEAFRGHGFDVFALAPPADPWIVDALSRIGVAFRAIRLSRSGTSPLEDARYYLELRKRIREIEPDVVFSYTIKPVIYGSLAARACGVKQVVSMITGAGYAFQKSTWKGKAIHAMVRPLYRMALASNDVVFFQNRDNLARFNEEGILGDSRKAALIPGSGVDLSHYAPVAPWIRPVTFLLIARLMYDKGIREYVEAARSLKAGYPESRFRLLGPLDPNPAGVPRRVVEAWQREGVIEYLPETRDVRPFLAEASVYVLPSYHEGMPRSVLEAMAMGRPIVTTDAPGCRETVVKGRNGYIVPVKDSAALSQAMERFMIDPSLIPKMGYQSRLLAEERFDVRKVNTEILSRMGILSRSTRGEGICIQS
jgi:glycosyltransferase involved in cell wall biosynthesis